MIFNTTIYYTDQTTDYIYNTKSLDVLANGFFRIVDNESTILLNPDNIEKIVADTVEEED